VQGGGAVSVPGSVVFELTYLSTYPRYGGLDQSGFPRMAAVAVAVGPGYWVSPWWWWWCSVTGGVLQNAGAAAH
jgi:hypothetical protein